MTGEDARSSVAIVIVEPSLTMGFAPAFSGVSRLPGVILAGIAGVTLSGSWVVLQTIFRNPLLDTFVLGNDRRQA